MPQIVFRTEDLSKVYDTGEIKVHALAGVDLELYAGELSVLLGPSGSGKSTLLNILGGLDHASSGRVWFRDFELTELGDRQLTRYRRDHVGFVFQFYNLVPSLSARENVQLVTDVAPDPMPADEALELVGLQHGSTFPAEMSGGERGVAMARASPSGPKCCSCDEPTGASTARRRRGFLEVLGRSTTILGTTTVVIPQRDPPAMAHRVINFRTRARSRASGRERDRLAPTRSAVRAGLQAIDIKQFCLRFQRLWDARRGHRRWCWPAVWRPACGLGMYPH